jgi:hypothetical protein
MMIMVVSYDGFLAWQARYRGLAQIALRNGPLWSKDVGGL